MIKTLKFSIGAGVAMLALFGMFSQASALTTSVDINLVGCASGSAFNTITGKPCVDATLNPPALGVLPYGCDLGVGTVYSPMTGESCSIGGVTITPPIVMMPPYDANGCKPGGPYSMTTGMTCPGMTPTSVSGSGSVSTSGCGAGMMYSTTTGAQCPSSSSSTGYDCTVAKNAYCAGTSTTTPASTGLTLPVNGACADGTVKMYNTSTGAAYCTTKTIPPTWIPQVRITPTSSASDVMALQASLNRALVGKLAIALVVDGKWGMKTTEAVKMFQAQAGIAADGKVGPITSAKLNASAY